MQIAPDYTLTALLMTNHLLQVRQVTNPASKTGGNHCVTETMHQSPLSIIIKERNPKLIANVS